MGRETVDGLFGPNVLLTIPKLPEDEVRISDRWVRYSAICVSLTAFYDASFKRFPLLVYGKSKRRYVYI